jgi:hypothetical protein
MFYAFCLVLKVEGYIFHIDLAYVFNKVFLLLVLL